MVSSNDVARLFLQTMISRRIVSDKLARVIWRKCVEAVRAADDGLDISYDPNKFDQNINELNRHLEPLDLKLVATVDEVVGKKLWAMINTKEDELAQVATDYSPVEIAYFKALIDQIVLASSESYSISSMTALREVNSLKPSMTKTQAEAVLANFVTKGWLLKSSRGRFSLSSRALLELQPYLKTNYEDDIQECTLCFELLTTGIRCYIPACNARLHNHCYKQYSSKTCLTCRADWSQPQKLMKIGEGAVKDGEDSRRIRRQDEEEDETDDTEEDEVEVEAESTKTRKAKASKGKQQNLKAVEGDGSADDDEMESNDQSPGPESQARRRKH